MAIEIERKFLLANDAWREGEPGIDYKQGYLNNDKERIVRIRTMGDLGRLTIKGLNRGMSRLEFEYDIPLSEAVEMLRELALGTIIHKTRYRRAVDGLIWEIDEFHGENEGLIVAEVELDSVDQDFTRPTWIGLEVTGDPRYFNSNLLVNPFSAW